MVKRRRPGANAGDYSPDRAIFKAAGNLNFRPES
jgi:hypothetical protein